MKFFQKKTWFSFSFIILFLLVFAGLQVFDHQATNAASRRLSGDGNQIETSSSPTNTNPTPSPLNKETRVDPPVGQENTSNPSDQSKASSTNINSQENEEKNSESIFDKLISFIKSILNFIVQSFGIQSPADSQNENQLPIEKDQFLQSTSNENIHSPKVEENHSPLTKPSKSLLSNAPLSRSAPSKESSSNTPATKDSSSNDTPTKDAPANDNSSKDTPTKDTPSSDTPSKDTQKNQRDLNSNSNSAQSTLSFPIRGAFYYPWFPETWTVNGKHVSYNVSSGYYNSSSESIVDKHIKALDYGNINLGIASWWGQGKHNETTRIPMLFNRTQALGSPLQWAMYYEKEGFGNPSISEIQADLNYLMKNYTKYPHYAKIEGKPVLFVYNADDKSSEVTKRWAQATEGKWYLVLKIFPGHEDAPNQPSAWHQYGPGTPTSHISGCFAISPGFKKADTSVSRLARDIKRWEKNVKEMVASNAPWQLILTFNEWGEGTAVESAKEWSSSSGYGQYLDILHKN